MKVGILAGGLGTRLAEETELKPKPMVEIGSQPILWHIMRYYHHFGMKDFYIACGYKADYIKRWFLEQVQITQDLTIDFSTGEVEPHGKVDVPDWKVHLIDTGLNTATGGRIKRLKDFVGDETCMVTWGDGVSTVDLNALLEFHKSHGKLATLTAARPPARFGHLGFDGDQVVEFNEKPQTGEGWINGAFFVFEPGVFDYIAGDDTQFELEPLMNLAADNQLMAYRHYDFWQCMDTVRDKKRLEDMWASGKAPWKLWD
ncbi:MAG: glucose-1-phosphate cytidylyltransferase [Actinomycetota bacterium]|nr:glucose-1-phosphate cytidylyltransferase [Actinomycetota bacterium]